MYQSLVSKTPKPCIDNNLKKYFFLPIASITVKIKLHSDIISIYYERVFSEICIFILDLLVFKSLQ